MSGYENPYSGIMWRKGAARVKSFSTASRAKATIVTIALEVTDGWELGDILRHCHEARRVGDPPKPAENGGEKP